jgi:hypothetical protein
LVSQSLKKCFIQHHDYLLCFIKVSNYYYLLFCTSLYNPLHTERMQRIIKNLEFAYLEKITVVPDFDIFFKSLPPYWYLELPNAKPHTLDQFANLLFRYVTFTLRSTSPEY